MNVMTVVIAAAAAVAVLAGAAAAVPFDPEEEDKKQVQILENYSVFSVFNASSAAAESDGPGSSPDSLIRFLDTIRSVNHDNKSKRFSSTFDI